MKQIICTISDNTHVAIKSLVDNHKYASISEAVNDLISCALTMSKPAVVEQSEPTSEPSPIVNAEPTTAPAAPITDGKGEDLDDLISSVTATAKKSEASDKCRMPDGRLAFCQYSDKSYFVAVNVEKNSPADNAILAKYGMKHQSTLPIVGEDGTEKVWYGYCVSAKKGGDINDVANYIRTIVGATSVEMWPDQSEHSAARKAAKAAKGKTETVATAEPVKPLPTTAPAAPICDEGKYEPKTVYLPIETKSVYGTLYTSGKNGVSKQVKDVTFYLIPGRTEFVNAYYYDMGDGKFGLAAHIGHKADGTRVVLDYGPVKHESDRPINCGGSFKDEDKFLWLAQQGLARAIAEGKKRTIKEWQIAAYTEAPYRVDQVSGDLVQGANTAIVAWLRTNAKIA